MKYICMLRPHANGRYQAGSMPLAVAELQLVLRRCGYEAIPAVEKRVGLEVLSFDCPALTDGQVREISRLAHLYLLAEEYESGLLHPLGGAVEAYLGDDLPNILKYKGKTNETFTHFLINMAYCSSAFFGKEEPLQLLDPMCGRGTTLFQALNRGWNATGVDVLAADVDEAGKFFKKYLEYHRIKHTFAQKSMTSGGRELAVVKSYEFARDAAAFKAGGARTLRLASVDSARIGALWHKPSFHLLAADLPYGVQHAPGGAKMSSLQQMLKTVLPVWRNALLPGGAMALSFNVNTLRLDFVREAMAEAGLEVMNGAGYDGLSHWVEQAITRDVAVAVRRS